MLEMQKVGNIEKLFSKSSDNDFPFHKNSNIRFPFIKWSNWSFIKAALLSASIYHIKPLQFYNTMMLSRGNKYTRYLDMWHSAYNYNPNRDRRGPDRLSSMKLWIRTPFMTRCIRYNIGW